jgi:Leucine-rich repeat (LRR) protein
MKNDLRLTRLLILLMAGLILMTANGFAQKKTSAQTHPTQKQPQKKTGKTQKKPADTLAQNKTAISFTPGQLEDFRQQSIQMVNYFASTLNFLADPGNSVKDKQIIINQSYLKSFWNPKVQVEDDLTANRVVPMYKDIQSYLTDVNFFFQQAKFTYTVQDVSVLTNDAGQTYFRVTANRNLVGLTVNNDSINSNLVRYIEINYVDSMQSLKIASIYTTKLNQKEDLRNWWNGLAAGWKNIFGKDLKVTDTLSLASIAEFNDSVAMVNGQKVNVDGGRVYNLLFGIVGKTSIDISGNAGITDLGPLGKLSGLKDVNISGLPVTDLMPLRNLNALEELDISGTPITSLDPLKYCSNIRVLRMKKTQVGNIALVSGMAALEVLDISQSPVDNLDPVSGIVTLKDLKCAGTRVSSLQPVSSLEALELLNFSGTPVSDAAPLMNLKKLQIVFFDDTKVKSLDAFGNLPDLKRIYCDKTLIDRPSAMDFMKKHPSVLVIFETEELAKWWETMSPEWKKVFNLYRVLNEPPSTEQLHDLLSIDSVNVNGRMAINTLSPVEVLTQLEHLEFANTAIPSVDPLKNLVYLKYINAANSKITTIDPLSGLKNLKFLNIENTQVNDIASLGQLKNLVMIYADNTGINLQEANAFLDGNPECLIIFQTYENTNWWKNIPQGWQESFLGQLKLTGTPDKVQLQQILNLEKIIVAENPSLTNLQPVVKFTRLQELQFTGTGISSLEPLSQMKTLRILRFPRNPITDLTPISMLRGLKELDMSNTPVDDLEPIQNLVSLEILKFPGTQVKSLKYLQNMTSLKILEFFNTRVSSLDELERMSNLKSLKIFNTKVSDKKVEKFKSAHPGCEVVFYK